MLPQGTLLWYASKTQ